MGIHIVVSSLVQYNSVQGQGQSNDTTVTPMNANQTNATSSNATKPVDGYGGPPTGPLNAVRHVFDDPTLSAYHFL